MQHQQLELSTFAASATRFSHGFPLHSLCTVISLGSPGCPHCFQMFLPPQAVQPLLFLPELSLTEKLLNVTLPKYLLPFPFFPSFSLSRSYPDFILHITCISVNLSLTHPGCPHITCCPAPLKLGNQVPKCLLSPNAFLRLAGETRTKYWPNPKQ